MIRLFWPNDFTPIIERSSVGQRASFPKMTATTTAASAVSANSPGSYSVREILNSRVQVTVPKDQRIVGGELHKMLAHVSAVIVPRAFQSRAISRSP
ncbi:hypothetical protein KIN20_006965 [Parelaphostrongylus tenuis]|uniref:Uncharacterized protein n=1 Tax=Parelaphostrongylus tenuis TaxID=148309 RepID=A0AAD5MUU2_PARTN|nr:hypothetical protein KIN20_006965 [Parelaphostrongylus tenuis]